ncbi:Outer membrane protein, OmpW [Candidatus Magnetomorum sp. HK-1]|nr:Outer membrane protein, OmpW [Candidatus Magnetomorum sp. HK-1]
MKTLMYSLVVILIISTNYVIASDISYDRITNKSIGVNVKHVFFYDDSLNKYGADSNFDIDSAMPVGINTNYFFNKNISIELSIDFLLIHNVNWTINGSDLLTDLLKINTNPINLTARYHFQFNKILYPYVGLGCSYNFNEIDSRLYEIDDSIGYNINIGSELICFNPRIAFVIEIKYFNLDAELTLSRPFAGFRPKYEVKLHGLSSSMGFNFYF